jgi:hypothetical protein
VGTDETGELLYDEVDYRGPTALVIGGEGEGIRRLVLEGCDQVVRIPMEGRVASLNAAAAGTVVLYEALRQRRRDVAPPGTQTPRPRSAEAPETEDLAETPELEDDLTIETDEVDAPAHDEEPIEEEPLDDLVGEDGELPQEVQVAPVPKAPRKTAAKKTTARKSTKKTGD